MSFRKTALTNYYNFAKKDKNNQISCHLCNRIIKGWGVVKCSKCNNDFCRSHMTPFLGSFGGLKFCPNCAKERNQFMEKNASIEAFRLAENNYNNSNIIDARIIEEKLFKSIFAGIDLFKFAETTDENIEQQIPQQTNDENQQDELEQTETDSMPAFNSEIPPAQQQIVQQPSIELAPQQMPEQISPKGEEQETFEAIALDSISEQIFDAMSEQNVSSEALNDPEAIKNLFSETFDKLFASANTNNKNIKLAILTEEFAKNPDQNKDFFDAASAKEKEYNNFFDQFVAPKLLSPQEMAALQQLGPPPAKPEIMPGEDPNTFMKRIEEYNNKMAPFEIFMNQVNQRMGLNQRKQLLMQTGNSIYTTNNFGY